MLGLKMVKILTFLPPYPVGKKVFSQLNENYPRDASLFIDVILGSLASWRPPL